MTLRRSGKARWITLTLVLVLALPYLANGVSRVWDSPMRRDSARLAPPAETTPEAVLQFYRAAVYGWRGLVADHTWVAAKPAGADAYTVYQVIGWRARRGLPVLSIERAVPDRYWWGSEPEVVADYRGPMAAGLIGKVDAAARRYPYADQYVMYPGPNSNSFTAWVALEVPELGLELPWRAIGKGWMAANYTRQRP